MCKAKFDDISRVFLSVLETGSNADDANIARSVLVCIGHLLAALDLQQLAHKSAVRAFQVQYIGPFPSVRGMWGLR